MATTQSGASVRIFRRLHALADLATDAIEAIVYLFHSDTAADDLWEQAADRLADDEALREAWAAGELKVNVDFPPMWDCSKWWIYQIRKTGEWRLVSCDLDRDYIFPTFEEVRSFFAQEVTE
jgi:hypothetical protein